MIKRSLFTLLIFSFTIVQLFANNTEVEKKNALNSYIQTQFELMSSDVEKPNYETYRRGLIGYLKLQAEGKVENELLTLIDFSISSKKKRMWIIDMNTNEVVHHSLVAHGKNSGFDIPTDFSNVRNTNKSSLGFYLTGEKYIGKYGLSLRLDGQETGFNTNARRRAIVMHPAKYVNEWIGKSLGRLGRSFGCPAIPYKGSDKIVKMIADKSVMFIYSPQKDYLAKTTFADELTAFNFLQKSGMMI